MASTTPVTAGSTLYAICTSSAPVRAAATVSAMIMATGSPTWRTLPAASGGCGGSFIGLPSLPLMPQAQGTPFTLSAISAAVKMATTCGLASAAFLSIARISACACGERRKTACSCRGRTMSWTYMPRPVRKRRSCLRRTGEPIPSWVMVALPGSSAAQGGRAGADRLDDVLISGAAADIALEPAAYLGVGRVGVDGDEVDRAPHDSRRAEARS